MRSVGQIIIDEIIRDHFAFSNSQVFVERILELYYKTV